MLLRSSGLVADLPDAGPVAALASGAAIAAALFYWLRLRALARMPADATARLAELQSRIRPHFLFNTLNMIAEQVYTDPAGADAMLTRLGVLLRSSFIETDRERVPLHRELELLESYVEIMRARFHGRLTFELDVDPATLDALVPRFVLQPLVENAIKHGVEPREEGGRVTVTTRRQANGLTLEVRDNGDGLGGVIREGTGVRNTRERLLHLYGEGRQRFALSPGAGGGTVALLEIPFDTDDGPPASYTATSPTPAVRDGDTVGVRRAPSPSESLLPPVTGARPVLRRSVS
jgi:two-component system, LytTR family, sensor histidine kinase AlgZ